VALGCLTRGVRNVEATGRVGGCVAARIAGAGVWATFDCSIWCTLRLAICEDWDVHLRDVAVLLALFSMRRCVAFCCLAGGVCSDEAPDRVIGGVGAGIADAVVQAAIYWSML